MTVSEVREESEGTPLLKNRYEHLITKQIHETEKPSDGCCPNRSDDFPARPFPRS